MVTITLTPELERVVTERAQRQGTTPELWTLDKLRETLQPDTSSEPAPETPAEDGTMPDFFAGYVGILTAVSSCREGRRWPLHR